MDKNFTQARWKNIHDWFLFFIVALENALLVLNTPYIGSENLINLAARPSFEFKILIPDGPTIKHK